MGRAELRCKPIPRRGETRSLGGRALKMNPGCLWSQEGNNTHEISDSGGEMEIELFAVYLYSFENNTCFNVFLLSAVHDVFLECQTTILILGISEKS